MGDGYKRVKIFFNNYKNVEKEINDFLEEKGIGIENIKIHFQSDENLCGVLIEYEECL